MEKTLRVFDSGYAEAIEDISPGTAYFIDADQGPNETWLQTFERIFPELVIDDVQESRLRTIADRARQGLPAYADGEKPKLNIGGILTFISLASLAGDILG